MADTDGWNGAARDAAREDEPRDGRSPSPRPGDDGGDDRRDARAGDARSRSPAPRRNDEDRGGRQDRGRPAARSGADNGENNPGNNLHVSGLAARVTDQDLEDAFKKFGQITKAQVMYDPHSREPRGFGFVTFETSDEAEAAITGMDGVELMGRNLKVQRAKRGRARTPTPGQYFGPPKAGEFGGRGGGGFRGGYAGGYGGGYGSGYGGYPRADPYARADPYRGGGGYGPPVGARGGYGPPADYPPRDPYGGRGGDPYGPPRDAYGGGDRYGGGGRRSPPPRGGADGYDRPPRGGDYGSMRGGPAPSSRHGDLPPPRSRYDDAAPARGGRY